MRIAIVGAECTGKKTLQQALITFLRTSLWDCADPVVENITTSLTGLAGYDLVLLTASDLRPPVESYPAIDWAARAISDRQLRAVLITHKIPHAVIYGEGPARTQCALDALAHFQKKPLPRSPHDTEWVWSCDTCSDAQCEHRIFSKLLVQA
jgi:hypothetical protein